MDDLRILSCAGQFNHHAVYMCDSIYNIIGSRYLRVSTEELTDERISLGFTRGIERDYNINLNENELYIFEQLMDKFDVIEFGAAPESFLNLAIKKNKIVLIRLERIFKQGVWKIFYPPIAYRYYNKYLKHKNNKNVYFLCISAYAAHDLKRLGIENDRVLSWAYCPEFIEYNESELHQLRNPNTLSILWLGRLIGWKHPEVAIDIAKRLKKDGLNFTMNIVGTGVLNKSIQETILNNDLKNEVKLLGAIPSDRVRDYMRKSDILLATSDFNEGWGVVINEAMNSGCAVVASHAMGAAPFLIKHGYNGLIYENGNTEHAYYMIKKLANDRNKTLLMGKLAYETIKESYSPEVYAEKFMDICNRIKNNQPIHVDEGIGSLAKIISNKAYKNITRVI